MPLDGDKRHLVVEGPLTLKHVPRWETGGRKHVRTNGQVVQQLCYLAAFIDANSVAKIIRIQESLLPQQPRALTPLKHRVDELKHNRSIKGGRCPNPPLTLGPSILMSPSSARV